jgi:anti-sigma factor RsiW
MVDEHVNEMLSGFVDGELTQQQRQRVTLHCDECGECRETLEDLRDLRERVGKARLSEVGEDKWRENMNETTTKTTRSVGWLLLIGGLLVAATYGIFGFLFGTGASVGEKLVVIAIYGGLAALFVSVLRQRLIERKNDKYKDVEI